LHFLWSRFVAPGCAFAQGPHLAMGREVISLRADLLYSNMNERENP
jgi:hypothetical protein